MPDSSSKSGSPRLTFITAPFSGGIGRGSAFRAGMPDSSSKSGSPTQPSSRPPFEEGLAGDPLFELESGIPARKADPQDSLHHGPLSGGTGPGSAFRAGMPDSSSKSGSPRQPSSRPPFQEGLAGDPLFELECRIPARKADPQHNLHHGPLFRRDWPGIRFSSWNAGFQLEKRIPKTTFITLVRRDWPGIRFSSWNAGFQLEKRIPKTTFITAPFSGGIGRGSAFRAGMPDSSSKSGSPRQPSSRPPFQEGLAGGPLFELECRIPARKADPQDNLHHGPLFRRDWPGIRFSSWNAGFQLEKRIPKTTFITAPFQERSVFSAETVLCFSAHLVVFFRSAGFARFPRSAPSLFTVTYYCGSIPSWKGGSTHDHPFVSNQRWQEEHSAR